MAEKQIFTIVGPIENREIEVVAPEKLAGGLPALKSSLKHIRAEMDLNSCRKTLFSLNQMGGIDCPGCAWPDPDEERSKLGEYCENGVKAIAEEATKKRTPAEFFSRHSIAELSNWSDFELGKSGRLTEPMILRKGREHYEAISWQNAFSHISKKLKSLADPNEAVFYTSGRTSNEAAFLYQLFVRSFGTNNLPDCSNMCHESSGVGLSETLGIGKGSVKLEDFYVTDLVIVIGQNPGTNHPRMLSALQKAKKSGAKIVSINPLPEAGLNSFKHPQKLGDIMGKGTKLADHHIPVKINGDVALLKGAMKLLLEEEKENPGSCFDHEFIENNTAGYADFIEDLEGYDIEKLSNEDRRIKLQMKHLADYVKKAEKIICCWAMGLTQHENGVANIKEIVNLLLLKGSIGKPGAGTCPVRGHSNVQGDRTMGIWEKPKDAFLNKLQENYSFVPPRKHGYDTVQSIQAMIDEKVKVFFAMGGNFISASPDTEKTGEAMQNCELSVQVSTKLNRSHLVTGKEAIILPCLGRTEKDLQNNQEQFVSVENSMGIVHSSQGTLTPASKDLKSEVNIISILAEQTIDNENIDWLKFSQNYDLIRDEIEKNIPGFENYNKRVRNPGGFYLPNGARDGVYNTDIGKAKFSINELPKIKMYNDELLMMTIRSHDQFNTTIYGLDDRYRGIINGRRIILMNRYDMENRRLRQGDLVDIMSLYNDVKRLATSFMVVQYPIPERCVATYFPETNVLIPYDQYAKKSHTPISKSVVVKVNHVGYPITGIWSTCANSQLPD